MLVFGGRLKRYVAVKKFQRQRLQAVIAITLAANLEPENVNEVTAPRMARREKILANILIDEFIA
jgi:hypothetical protein